MHRFVRHSLALCLTLSAAACSAVDATPDDYVGAASADLTGAELPADLDPEAEGQGPEMAFVADPSLPADGDPSALLPPPGDSLRSAVVAVRWGYFPPEPAETWTDWSGFIAISSGTVELIRPLRFEDGAVDDVARPGLDPRVVRFRSHTRPAWDGVLVRVTRPSLAPAVVVIHAGGVTRVLPFEELRDLNAAETVDDAGHELRIAARALPAEHPCVVQVGEAHGTWPPQILDVRGPYGLWRTDAGRGVFAQFRYSPGGVFLGRLDEGGGILGRFAAGTFDAVIVHRDPACD
jgi:hypothetical protein